MWIYLLPTSFAYSRNIWDNIGKLLRMKLCKHSVFLKPYSARGWEHWSDEELSCRACLQLSGCRNSRTVHRSAGRGREEAGFPISQPRSSCFERSSHNSTFLKAQNSNQITQDPQDPCVKQSKSLLLGSSWELKPEAAMPGPYYAGWCSG